MTSAELAIHLVVPALIAVVFWIADSLGDRRTLREARVVYERARLRYLEGRDAGAVRVVGRVISADGSPVTIGTSVEKPEAISGTPTLTTAEWCLVANDGRRYGVRAGAPLRVARLPGAERKLVRTLTTTDGVEQTYSFELPDGLEVALIGAEHGARGDGAFREGTTSLAPFLGEYALGLQLEDPGAAPSEPTRSGTKAFRVLVVAALAAATVAGFIPYIGSVIWWGAVAIAVLLLFLVGFGSGAAPALDPQSRARLTELERVERKELTDERAPRRAG